MRAVILLVLAGCAVDPIGDGAALRRAGFAEDMAPPPDMVRPCAGDADCEPWVERCCEDVCVRFDDPVHCGACGNACTSAQTCCGDVNMLAAAYCTDLRRDRQNCGACGLICRGEAAPACADGWCTDGS